MRQINPVNNNGTIQLKFSVEGKRYSFTPFAKSSFTDRRDIKKAVSIACKIERDIESGYFDTTLARYRESPKAIAVVNPTVKLTYALEIWDAWVNSLQLKERTLKGHYAAIRVVLFKGNPTVTEMVQWATTTGSKWSSATYNERLGYLRRCFRWAVSEGLTDANPLEKLTAKRRTKEVVKPFTPEEIRTILNALRSNQFNAPASAYRHVHYADWVEFLFITGCRPSEAIGLQVRHIDFVRGHIEISTTLARGDRGETNGAARVRKGTKTGSVRYLPLTPRLRALLEDRCAEQPSEALVFTSPTGQAIDDRMFSQRVWKRVLEGLKLPYRRLYIARHSFASIALEQGTPIATVAYLLGHSDLSMITRTYGHLVSKPVMPDVLG